ncbi:MAG: hypothetical protein Ct9H300mP8_10530 [Gammaproteobacteria bacterium]|nr:MAG: hypothetical protein Ct9H300mP8_10530 [Gammaproteobacteria bacterium]
MWRLSHWNSCTHFPSATWGRSSTVSEYQGRCLVSGGPHEQGAWYSSQHHIRRVILTTMISSTCRMQDAKGSPPRRRIRAKHLERQQRLVREALFD